MRASRLLQLLLLLQNRGRMTGAQLAEELEVSLRTIYRDVEALSSSGVPVYTESGPGGGVQLVDGYQTRLTGLTTDEAVSLGFSGLPSAASQLGLGAVLVAAQAKVDAALPPELRSRAERVRERFLVDAPGWFRREEGVPFLPALSEAVWDSRRVDVRYRRRDTTVRRVLSPLGLVLKSGTWYVVALAGRDRAVRTYRVSRIAAVRRRDEQFERPDRFDLAETWGASAAAFQRDLLALEVHARVRSDALWRLRHALPAPAGDEAVASASSPDAHGWCDVSIRSESVEVAHDELLRMGATIEIVEPVALRLALATTARNLAALNR